MLTLVKRSGPADSGAVAALAPLDEATLIARVRAGDRPAQDEFYRRFKRLVAGNLYRVAGDRGDLEDLVQEVFVIAFRGLDRFRGDARLSTWLYRICINVSLGRMRSRSRKPLPTSVADIDANATTSWADAVETPERALVRRQDQARVHAALEQLAPKKRIVLAGEVPSPSNPPTGCYFHPRCRYAQDICAHEAPPLVNVTTTNPLSHHLAACHFADRLTLTGVVPVKI